MVLRVLLILTDSRDMSVITACFVFYWTTFWSRMAFLQIGGRIGHFNLQHHKKLIIASTIFHIAITVATVRSTIGESEDVKRIVGTIGSQLGLGIISGLSTTEFLMVLTGGFRSRSVEGNLIRELNTERIDSYPIIECNICLVEFSAFRIPRILKKCGHTICERCVDRIIRNSRIACPMCQTETVVDGTASKLSANLDVLEFVERIKIEL